jgi:hypothetical protein
MTFQCPVVDCDGQCLKEWDHVVHHAQPGRDLERTGELQKGLHGKNCARHHHRSRWEREADAGAVCLLHGGCGWESTDLGGCVAWPGERTLQGGSGDPRTTCRRTLDDLHVGSGIHHSWWTTECPVWRVRQDETRWTLGCGCCSSRRRARGVDT